MSRRIQIEARVPCCKYIADIMRRNKCSRGDAFLAVFNVASWMEERLNHGYVCMTRSEVDSIAGLDGVADALEADGKLAFSKSGKAFYFSDSPRTFWRVKRAWMDEAASCNGGIKKKGGDK